MNTTKLIRSVSVKTGFTQAQVRFIYDSLVEAITEQIDEDARINLRGLGTLTVRNRQAYKGRNPATGEPLLIPAKNVLRFVPARSLKGYLPAVQSK